MPHIARSPRQLGNIIQRARKQRGLTQTELAQLSGLRQEMISRIETGHEGTKLSSLYALFAALDLDLLVDTRGGKASKEIEDIF
ncbi:helix-turn-helix domain-containing protein [Novosphingobium sp. B1]|uniref:helix-turn-helix domain-containing protein n=1 Tax=Novosphingobium sp. B1 TaxID=1938756 RepID=UPI0009D8A3F0|nr:helix-turn-helix domain-containing protein [Novosphingobium sp. B1]SMD08753.1 transcriptional regulator, XRE family [Novosphingobium sp. B1]